MSQYVSYRAAERISSFHEVRGFLLLFFLALTLTCCGGYLLNKYLYPNPMGYLCPNVQGVAEVHYGRKHYPDKINGEVGDASGCVYIELPHNR